MLSLVQAQCSDRIHLVGHSYGGATAVRFALANPHLLQCLVLIEPILTQLLKFDGQNDLFNEYLHMAHAFLDYANAGADEDAWRLFIDYRNSVGTWNSLSMAARNRFLERFRF